MARLLVRGIDSRSGSPFGRQGTGDAVRAGAPPTIALPPDCPVCRRRLVILSARTRPDAHGIYVRQQLWGCPGGHSTAAYVDGVFGETELLPFAG